MGGIGILVALFAAGAPVPETAPGQVGTVDRYQASSFAWIVDALAMQVKDRCTREGVTEKDLIAAAVRGLYDEIGKTVPESLLADIRKAEGSNALVDVLSLARMQLGNHPKLAGSRSLFAAINGFRHATDSNSTLVSPRLNAYASGEQDFGIGVELEGVVGLRWTIYNTECGIASRRFPVQGYFGPIPREHVPCPAVLPWRVRRVVPGSPAQKSGVKPGDVILKFDGAEVTTKSASRLFNELSMPLYVIDPQTGKPTLPEWRITFQRNQEKPVDIVMKGGQYMPESAFGVVRNQENQWDCMLDRQARIGYIRIGPVEMGLDEAVKEMVADLVRRRCRGLILDLRWCPGGYIDPGARIAGLFLKEGTVLAKMKYRSYQSGTIDELLAPSGSGEFLDLPLVVLAGQETTGGGELIAAALRDNNRCVIVGQRTVGRASIMNTIPAGFGDVQFKLTTGTSFRPNGKNRMRLPDSKPTDDWGVRPDEGLEVPVTLDKSMELHRQADLQALRPGDSTEALPFDDPHGDPYRMAALAYFRKKLGGN